MTRSIYPDGNRSLVWQLREASKHCHSEDVRASLRVSADKIAGYITVLSASNSMDALKLLNGEVARAVRLWEKAQMPPNNPPRTEVHRELRAA